MISIATLVQRVATYRQMIDHDRQAQLAEVLLRDVDLVPDEVDEEEADGVEGDEAAVVEHYSGK